MSERIRWVPLPMHITSKLLCSLVLLATLHGSCVSCIGVRVLNSSTSSVDYSSSRPTRRKRNPTSLSLTLLDTATTRARKHQPKGRRFRRIEPSLPAAFNSRRKPKPITGKKRSMKTRGTLVGQQTVSSSWNVRDGWFKRIGTAKMPHLWRSRPERDSKSENELRGQND